MRTQHDAANTVTLLRLFIGLAAAGLIAHASTAALAIAIALHFAIYGLDTLDGHIARKAGPNRAVYASRVGGFLDGAVDSIVFCVVALVLMRRELVTDWTVHVVVVSRLMLMTIRGAAALGNGTPLGPTGLTKISGGAMGLGSLVVIVEAISTGATAEGPTTLGMLASVAVTLVVLVALTHYLFTIARETVAATLRGVGGGA